MRPVHSATLYTNTPIRAPAWRSAEHPEERKTKQTHHREDQCRIVTAALTTEPLCCPHCFLQSCKWRIWRTAISLRLCNKCVLLPHAGCVSCCWLCCLSSVRLMWDSLGQMPYFYLCFFCRDNILVLDVFFEALNYETIEQKKAYEVAGLLGRFWSSSLC